MLDKRSRHGLLLGLKGSLIEYELMTHPPTNEELERRKLNAEIAELERPLFRRPTVWFGVVAALVAIVGMLGQR